MNHQIQVKDLQHFETKVQMLAQFNSHIRKSLNVITRINVRNQVVSTFTVERDYKVVCETTDLEIATKEYNKI